MLDTNFEFGFQFGAFSRASDAVPDQPLPHTNAIAETRAERALDNP